MIDVNAMIMKEIENGYGDANAQAKVCQDLILKAIATSRLNRNVTIKGGLKILCTILCWIMIMNQRFSSLTIRIATSIFGSILPRIPPNVYRHFLMHRCGMAKDFLMSRAK